MEYILKDPPCPTGVEVPRTQDRKYRRKQGKSSSLRWIHESFFSACVLKFCDPWKCVSFWIPFIVFMGSSLPFHKPFHSARPGSVGDRLYLCQISLSTTTQNLLKFAPHVLQPPPPPYLDAPVSCGVSSIKIFQTQLQSQQSLVSRSAIFP